MAKFSEFMQHSRVAKLLNLQQGTIDPENKGAAENEGATIKTHDIGDSDAATPQSPALPLTTSASQQEDQAITQDEIVAHTVTPDSPAPEDTGSADDSDQYSETVWEDALHSLPHPVSSPRRHLHRLLPTTARIGVLGLVAVAMWWTWPRSDDPNTWIHDARAGDVESFAVVNPANVEPSGVVARSASSPTADATNQAALFTNIIIVTPTSIPAATPENGQDAESTPAEPIVLEASALVTDVNDGTIVIEIPEAAAVEALVPALEAEPSAAGQQNVSNELVLVPTATPSPTPQTVAIVSSNAIPRVEIVPAVGVKFTPTEGAPTATPTATEVPTATPAPIGPGRLWSTFAPLSATQIDHFWFGNPFEGTNANSFSSPSYLFGSTGGNRYRPHHGLDFSNPTGTPVQAAVTGTVVHAGPDDPLLLGPYPNFYGKAVVIRLDKQLSVAGGQLDVFLLYGHLSEVMTEVGQHVEPSDIIGLVGMTGIAIGPHLHVEARLGVNDYDHSINPYLWLKPPDGDGAVAVRVLTANGRTWAGAKVSIAQFIGGRAVWGRQIDTYLDTENIGPDPVWGENGAMGEVPAGSYTLVGNINGESVRADFTVNAGETTFVEIRTKQ